MKKADKLFDGSNAHELAGATGEKAVSAAEDKSASGGSPGLNAAMLLLAECELHVDEWNFPITLADRIKAKCDEFYGDVRPSFD
jgi:hypothetical protein